MLRAGCGERYANTICGLESVTFNLYAERFPVGAVLPAPARGSSSYPGHTRRVAESEGRGAGEESTLVHLGLLAPLTINAQ